MAAGILYVAEFAETAVTGGGLQIGRMPPLAEQQVAIDAVSAASAAFNASTAYIRVHADQICSIAVGSAPTAAATNMRLVAGQTEYFGVTAGHKIAAITNT